MSDLFGIGNPAGEAVLLAMAKTRLIPMYHGGVAGLNVGDYVLPPAAIGRKPPAWVHREIEPRRDMVYVTWRLEVAKLFAAFWRGGKGALYRVEPVGELELDPEDPYYHRTALMCPRALVVEVLPVDPRELKEMMVAYVQELQKDGERNRADVRDAKRGRYGRHAAKQRAVAKSKRRKR